MAFRGRFKPRHFTETKAQQWELNTSAQPKNYKHSLNLLLQGEVASDQVNSLTLLDKLKHFA